MPRTPNTLDDVFEGEHLGPLIETVSAAIEKARDAGEYLQIECRLEPRGGRSRQTQLLDVDPDAPSPPIPEALVQELYRHYLNLAEEGFRGTLRMNFRQKGNSQVVYESFQRSIVIPSEEDEEEYYGGPGLDAPHLDLTLEDPDEAYLTDAPRGVLSSGRVGGLTAKHADYMFLPLYQETIATAERRTDALLRTFVDSQTAMVEMHRSATESNTTIIERLLERLPRGSLQIGEEPEESRSRDKGISDWLGSMLISQVKKSLVGGKKASKQVTGGRPPAGIQRPQIPAPEYDGWGEAPTFGVPAVHPSEWGEDSAPAADFDPPPSPAPAGGSANVDLIHEIRKMSQQDPNGFRQLVQENSDELLPVFMDALDDDDEE